MSYGVTSWEAYSFRTCHLGVLVTLEEGYLLGVSLNNYYVLRMWVGIR